MKISIMNKMKSFCFIIGVILIVMGFIYSAGIVLDTMKYSNQPKTIELTVEHLWEEDSKYYFADNDGNIYMLGNYRDVSDKIVYSDMPKQRFGRLNEGNRYEIEYISGLDTWISISEKEVGK